MRRAVHAPLAFCGLWLACFELHAFGLRWIPTGPVRELHLVVMAVCAALCLMRAVTSRQEAAPWALIGAGLFCWIAGESYFTFLLWNDPSPPVPSPADIGFLLFPPLVFVGFALLLRERVRGISTTLWVDGVTSALAVGAVCAAVVVQAVLDVVGGSRWAIVTNLAYPVSDLVLLGLVIGGVCAAGWRVNRTFALLMAGVLTFTIADSIYLVLTAKGTWSSGGPVDGGWWITAFLFATAAWQPSRARAAATQGTRTLIAIPIAFAMLGLGVLVAGSVWGHSLNLLAILLAAASLFAVMLRLILTYRENVAMLTTSRHEALSDDLTGLGNRRALTAELERLFDDGREAVLVLYDLNGFKYYNDSFGHPAGDALLERLGSNLVTCLGARGRAFRMGGDEFCTLVFDADERLLVDCALALGEAGEGFSISCAWGAVRLPEEAGHPSQALRIADQRLYADKRGGRRNVHEETREVMLRMLAERDPALGDHGSDVADLAEEVARDLGLAPEIVEHVRLAAELHDVGKIAIPDRILNKRGPLDDSEWLFMRRHTLIGERIIAASPAMAPAAAMVRSSHERWDGAGYPDGLAGERIPLGARIVAVCDAYDAMTKDRAYRAGMDSERALSELDACSGTQFDPRVVAAFGRALADRESERAHTERAAVVRRVA